MSEELIILKNRCCMDCGKTINVSIDKKTKKVTSGDWYYGKIRFGIGMWSQSRMEGTNPDGSIHWVRVHSRFKELWYKLIDLKRLIFHQYEDTEMWVCKECVLAQYGSVVRIRSENPSQRYEEKIEVRE